jgi:SAM-dependent methyltransferase
VEPKPVERRLVFGQVAEEYDRHRPTYPEAVIDRLVSFARAGGGGRAGRALEVGAGTGKATVAMAARGVAVTAVEPSSAMAAVARRNTSGYPDVTIVESDFERWDAGGETFPLLYSAQAWHWVDPAARYVRGRLALEPGGTLVALWNIPAWRPDDPVRAALSDVYRATVPDLRPDGPLHPDNHTEGTDEDWHAEIARAERFADPTVSDYPWSIDYDATQYVGLLSTLSENRLLEPAPRAALFDAVAAAIDAHGGTVHMPMTAHVCTARAV